MNASDTQRRPPAAMLVRYTLLLCAVCALARPSIAVAEEPVTMRPFRVPRRITLTVGQDEGDLQGKDDKIIQAAVDYVARLGGGTVKILPGTYAMNNAVFLRAGITLQGAGETTILQKGPCHSTPLVRDSDWYEWGIVVKNTKGFTPGCGIAVSNNKPDWPPVCLFTVTAVRGNVLFLDQKLDKNFWVADAAQAQTLHSLICGYDTDDVVIENIVLDGARDQNDYLNDNFGGAAFMQDCNRWTFRNVVARNFNGDGFSFQVCDDIHFDACRSTDNAGRGFHPGSGSCRPVFKRCTATGNSRGLFWCWGACDGLAEDCTFSENTYYGSSFGHRDTNNVLRRCTFERNGQWGVVFREEESTKLAGNSNRIEECLIRDNGVKDGCGVEICGPTQEIAIVRCRFENSAKGGQKTAIRIGPKAERIVLEGNSFAGCPVEIDDQRPASREEKKE